MLIQINPPEMELEMFLDPKTGDPLEYLIADGESQATNNFHLYYGSTDIPDHTINWKFRFWDITTLDTAIP